jgi:hypothetical protein
MKCDEFEETVHRSLDQRAIPWSCERLQEHARVCTACRDLLDACEELSDGLTFFEIEGPDDTFSQSVISAVTTARRGPRSGRKLSVALAAVAASALLLLLPDFLSWRPASPNTPSSPLATNQRAADAQAQDPPASAEESSGEDALPPDKASIDQVNALLADWRNRWSSEDWKPVDRLEGGLAPITTTLSIAIDELRATIPLGKSTRSPEAPGESAGTWLDLPSDHTA